MVGPEPYAVGRRVAACPATLPRLLACLVAVFTLAGSMLTAPDADAAPITITDIMGRTVVLPAKAERIVLASGRQLPALGLISAQPVSLLAGWRDDFRRDAASYDIWKHAFPALDDVPAIGAAGGDLDLDLDLETIIGIQPDLVVLTLYDAQSPSITRNIDVLEQLDIPVLVIDFFSHPLENSLPSLRMLGEAIGESDRADAFISFYEERLDRIRERLDVPDLKRPTVFMHVHAGGMPCCPSPGHGVFNDMIDIAGGYNTALDHVSGLYGDVSLEQLMVDNPDFYIATGGAYLADRGGLVLGPGIGLDQAENSFANLLRQPGLAELDAVSAGRARALWHMFNDTPAHIVMIEWLAKLFHPDRFSDVDPQETMDVINRDFLAAPMEGIYWLPR